MWTTNWHLPRALSMTEWERHLPSTSMEIKPHATITVDLQQPLREFSVEWVTLCSRDWWVRSLESWMLFSSVQFNPSVSPILWIAACQASLSITNSWSLLKLMSIESVMPSNHLILCHPLLLPPSIFASIRVFSNESALHIRWPRYWSFSFRTDVGWTA